MVSEVKSLERSCISRLNGAFPFLPISEVQARWQHESVSSLPTREVHIQGRHLAKMDKALKDSALHLYEKPRQMKTRWACWYTVERWRIYCSPSTWTQSMWVQHCERKVWCPLHGKKECDQRDSIIVLLGYRFLSEQLQNGPAIEVMLTVKKQLKELDKVTKWKCNNDWLQSRHLQHAVSSGPRYTVQSMPVWQASTAGTRRETSERQGHSHSQEK